MVRRATQAKSILLALSIVLLSLLGCATGEVGAQHSNYDYSSKISTSCEPYLSRVKAMLLGKSVWFNPARFEMACSEGKSGLPSAWSELRIKTISLGEGQLPCDESLDSGSDLVELNLEFDLEGFGKMYHVSGRSTLNAKSKNMIQADSLLYNSRSINAAVNCLLPWNPQKRFPQINWSLIRKGKTQVGMNVQEVIFTSGSPDKINRTVVGGHEMEQWIYEREGLYLYIENGKLTSFQQ